MMNSRNYSELILIPTFEERLEYLRIPGQIGISSFGFDRYLNQAFYTSREWRMVRNKVIARDNACDLGIFGMDIHDSIRVHHMNAITVEDIESGNPDIINPEFLICTSLDTHNFIHFGRGQYSSPIQIIERTRGDTTPWKVY